MNISQDFVKGMVKDGYDYMLESYDELSEVWPQIFEEKSIDGDYWQRTSVVNSGTWRKTAGNEPFMTTKVKEGYTVYAAIFDYTDAHSFSYNTIRDHQKIKNLGKEIAGGWGSSSKETREEFYARIFNKGGLTSGDFIFNGTPESKAITDDSGDLCYDSEPFINLSNNTRDSIGGASYYNGFALNLDPTNLKAIRTHGMANNNRRENDTRFNLQYDTLIVPPNLSDTADEVLGSTLIAYNSTNTTNVLRNKLKPITWSYLTDTDAFFVGQAKKGICAIKRMEPTIDFFQDKKNRCFWYTAEMRMGVMIYNWRYWLGSNAATS